MIAADPTRLKMRVLISEDNRVNQKITLAQLQKLGDAADAVANGLEVLEALENIPYEIVFMDCQMPQMDSYDESRAVGRGGVFALVERPDAPR